MSDLQAEAKATYQSPVLMPLGALAKGSGVCTTGSSVVGGAKDGPEDGSEDGTCGVGTCPGAFSTATCSAGTSPADYCTAGTCATQLGASYCSVGNMASPSAYCSAGNSGGACDSGASA